MMTYPAPEGYIIKSKSNPTACEEIRDGTYESFETTFAPTEIGIQLLQFHIKTNIKT